MADFVYYSFETISTLGTGDIRATTVPAETLVGRGGGWSNLPGGAHRAAGEPAHHAFDRAPNRGAPGEQGHGGTGQARRPAARALGDRGGLPVPASASRATLSPRWCAAAARAPSLRPRSVEVTRPGDRRPRPSVRFGHARGQGRALTTLRMFSVASMPIRCTPRTPSTVTSHSAVSRASWIPSQPGVRRSQALGDGIGQHHPRDAPQELRPAHGVEQEHAGEDGHPLVQTGRANDVHPGQEAIAVETGWVCTKSTPAAAFSASGICVGLARSRSGRRRLPERGLRVGQRAAGQQVSLAQAVGRASRLVPFRANTGLASG